VTFDFRTAFDVVGGFRECKMAFCDLSVFTTELSCATGNARLRSRQATLFTLKGRVHRTASDLRRTHKISRLVSMNVSETLTSTKAVQNLEPLGTKESVLDAAVSAKKVQAPGTAALYFAYGSNMCPRVLGPDTDLLYLLRRISSSSWETGEPAVLEGFSLEFSCPGVEALGEPAFANIVPAVEANSGAPREQYDTEVHGVLFRLTQAELDRILLSEGVGLGRQRVVNVTVRTYRNVLYENVKTVAYVSWEIRNPQKPSSRYLELILEGANYFHLDIRYVRTLLRKASGEYTSAALPATNNTQSDMVKMLQDIQVPQQIVAFYQEMHHLKGTVRFIMPPMLDESSRATRPLLLFFPGLDGTGISIATQLRMFQSKYDVRILVIPRDNRMPLDELGNTILDCLECLWKQKTEVLMSKEVSHEPQVAPDVLAESMGCLLWFECVRAFRRRANLKCGAVDPCESPTRALARHVMLVNPATSFSKSALAPVWENISALPDPVYHVAPYIFSPILIDLLQLLAEPSMAFQSLQRMGVLREILPKETLRHRVRLIRDFRYAADDFAAAAEYGAEQYTIAVAANDALLPSLAESESLLGKLTLPFLEIQKTGVRRMSSLPATVVRYVATQGGHALLQSGSFDAYQQLMVKAERAHDRIRRGLLERIPKAAKDSHTRSSPSQHTTDVTDKTMGSGFVTETLDNDQTLVARSPTNGQLDRYAIRQRTGSSVRDSTTGSRFFPRNKFALGETRWQLQRQRRLLSPIFLDFDKVPLSSSTRPVLFVGNHTRLGLIDLPFLIDQVWKSRGVFVRGLAHPIIFAMQQRGQSQWESAGDRQRTRARDFATNLAALGAVSVSPRTVYSLLRNGDSLLLFPGGAREAYKRRGENNQIFWPKDEEFVRLCARLDAVIVPFASFGPDDSFDVVADGEELLNVPFLGGFIRNQFERMGVRADIVRAWRSPLSEQPSDAAIADLLIPLLRPRPPLRLYFQFFDPVYPDASLVRDRQRAQSIYEDIRSTVANGLRHLECIAKRQDAYLHFHQRFLYESLHQGAQAPTLTPWSTVDAHLLLD
jgi:1-acyl-sn-glycerol-3-phosphate acyltransferase